MYLCLLISGSAKLAFSLGLLIGVSISIIFIRKLAYTFSSRIVALHNGLNNLIDGDFSVSLANTHEDELGQLIEDYNRVSDKLRRERQNLYQRELMLDTVIQNTSLCLVLTDDNNRIIYCNDNANHMFNSGKPIKGLNFNDILDNAPKSLKDIIEEGKSALFSVNGDGGEEDSYYVSLGRFILNTKRHNLYLIKQMTKEISRRESDTWKKIIRIISHEINNSLAPISSMSHCGLLMIEQGEVTDLEKVLVTIGERAEHLREFIGGYARLSKLPIPIKSEASWKDIIQGINLGYSYTLVDPLPLKSVHADISQLGQLLVNLLKNAHESGSKESDIELRIACTSSSSIIEVLDRGRGMSKYELENALQPFYTTKLTGSGVGLPLCREVVEAHNGEISISNRENGGVKVMITLPISSVN